MQYFNYTCFLRWVGGQDRVQSQRRLGGTAEEKGTGKLYCSLTKAPYFRLNFILKLFSTMDPSTYTFMTKVLHFLYINLSFSFFCCLQDATTGKLRLLSCARTELNDAIDKVKAEGYITRQQDGKPTEIFTCGIGCHQFGARINRELNVKYVIFLLVKSHFMLHDL